MLAKICADDVYNECGPYSEDIPRSIGEGDLHYLHTELKRKPTDVELSCFQTTFEEEIQRILEMEDYS
jgi:hypothetical protein